MSSLSRRPVPILDFSRQYLPLREEILSAISEVCDSQSFILGPAVTAFEAAVTQACGVDHALGCASGTDALWLALASCGLGDSALPKRTATLDCVVTTPFSFFATASSILRAGCRPIFADIDPRTFNLSACEVARVVREPGVKAVLTVHLYGQCADMDALHALKEHKPELLLIEDAAQAFGATWASAGGPPRAAGALGEAAAFSFYPTKNLAAFGDAGLLTTQSEKVATRARSLRAHGMTRRYFHDEVGWNSRMDSIQAAVLQVKLRHLPAWNQQRRGIAARYDALFRAAGLAAAAPSTCTEDGVVLPWTDSRATHVFHQYVIRAPRRDALRQYLTQQGIGSEIYYPGPLHLQSALSDLGYRSGDFPEAERAAAEVLALPIFPELRADEQETVVDAIRRFYA
ncbi:MAG: DegT/DnrJ/EryC1/StrS family aminotransferase [Acidobacteriaceae bacterium]